MNEYLPPSVVLPERLDRPMRLGPFPSARAALKFVTYCAVGALLVPFAGGWVWLPFLLLGMVVSVHRTGEKGPDERLVDFVLYQLRQGGVFSTHPGRVVGRARGPLIRLPSGNYVAIVETRGSPILHLPPREIEDLFSQYRDFLRALDGGCAFVATVAPLSAVTYEPPRHDRPESYAVDARSGYDEFVRLLCRRRYVRRIFFAFGSSDGSPAAVTQLETRVAMSMERFQRLGVGPVRLRGRSLKAAAYRFEWPVHEVE
jgi:hypothetical protein